MDSSNLPETREQVLRWLAFGSELAQNLYGPRTTHRHVIWRLLQDAIHNIDSTPDQEKSWLTAGFRSGGWANIVNTKWDVELVERHRLMSGMKPTDEGSPRSQPQRDELERSLTIMDWLQWCDRGYEPRKLQLAAVALARGGDHAAVHKIYGKKSNRQTIFEIKNRTIDAILRGLNDDLGIAPGPGLTFTETFDVTDRDRAAEQEARRRAVDDARRRAIRPATLTLPFGASRAG